MPGPQREARRRGRRRGDWAYLGTRTAPRAVQESIGCHFLGLYFRFNFQTLSGTWFGTVWDAFGCLLGIPSRGKSSDFVKDILKKHSFAHDHLPEPFLKPPGKDSRPILDPPWEPSWSPLGLLYPKTCLTFVAYSTISYFLVTF